MMRFMLALIGYLGAATVITAVGGYGYLRYSGALNDEKMFRVMAVLQDVDIAGIDRASSVRDQQIPPEEDSYEQQQEQLQIATLHFDAKRKALEESLEAFDHRFSQLNEATARFNRLSEKVETFLEQQQQQVMDEALKQVRDQLQMLIPKKQAKPILIKMIEDDDEDEVIQLLSSLPQRSRKAVLETFVEPEDVQMLYRLTQRMLEGDPAKPYIDKQLEQLREWQSQEK